ncbi:MAG: SLC13 family permease, partial [Planctomycetota bacterium]
MAVKAKWVDWKKHFWMAVGVALFCILYFSPPFAGLTDPKGNFIALTHEGKAALGLFLLAATWWVFEVVPIGVTSIAIGVIQVLFLIRHPDSTECAKAAFGDFMDPAVWFIIGSITFGMVFSKTGLTRRMAYRMLVTAGERTSMIYLGSFTIYPLLMAIYALYTDEEKPTRFGKGLFIGMAFVAGAGSIITLLGAARGAVAIGFFKDIAGREVTFFELSYYMAPVGVVMVFLLWGLCMVLFKPEQK